MGNGMKVKMIKKVMQTSINKDGDKVTKEVFSMKCEDRVGNKMVLISPEPLQGFAAGQVIEVNVKEDQKLLADFKKAEEEEKAKKEAEKEAKKKAKMAGVKEKRQ